MVRDSMQVSISA